MHSVLAGILVLVFGGVLGCSKAAPTVEGMVTLDGQPLETGSITFVPSDGKSQTAGGAIAAGKYGFEVPPGMMKVEITAGKVVGKKKAYETPDSPLIDVIEQIIPAKYNSETSLSLDVKAGKNSKDFALTSQ